MQPLGRRRGYFLTIIMVVACLCTSSAAAQTDISLAQVQSAAARLEAQGQRQEAARLAAALLQRDPTDASAWVVVARIRRAAGDIDGALEAARNANAYADTNEERFAAAVELAAGNVLKDRNLYAQFWLRRAAQVAPTEDLQEQAIRNFRAVRAQTPWRFTFGFSVVPSSNVNNGSSEEILELFGLPFVLSGDAQALSGVEFTLTSTAFYRFDGFGDEPAVLSFGVAVQRVALSDAAKEQAPEASGSDYAFDALEVGFSQVVSNWSEASVSSGKHPRRTQPIWGRGPVQLRQGWASRTMACGGGVADDCIWLDRTPVPLR